MNIQLILGRLLTLLNGLSRCVIIAGCGDRARSAVRRAFLLELDGWQGLPDWLLCASAPLIGPGPVGGSCRPRCTRPARFGDGEVLAMSECSSRLR